MAPGDPTAESFDRLVGKLKRWFNVIPLDDAAERLVQRRLPRRPLCITFDDGYADNYRVALPILRKHGLPATFFIATGYLDGGCMFNDLVRIGFRHCGGDVLDLSAIDLGTHDIDTLEKRRRAAERTIGAIKYLGSPKRERTAREVCRLAAVAVPDDLMMSSDELRDLSRQGMGVGGHTRTHPILACSEDDVAWNEIVNGKSDLEEATGRPITTFAYPNGQPGLDYLATHVRMAREAGFVCAVSTAPGAGCADSDVLQLPRFMPWGTDSWKFGLRLAGNLRTAPERRA